MNAGRAIVATLLVLLAGCRHSAPPVVLATTTSVANSGLLADVLPAYDGPPVRVVQVGSGRALAMMAAGQADVVISHAPQAETEALRTHPSWIYRKILYNDFLIVGPSEDPAQIAGMTDAVEAMKRILQSHQRFLSRGDESGTHERERQLWGAAGIKPRADDVTITGAGMGQTLRIASETGAYTLSDRGTFEMLARPTGLRALVAGDPRLLNTYAVVADPANQQGLRFARWLAEGEGARTLTSIIARGTIRGFTVWPAGGDRTRPDARPF